MPAPAATRPDPTLTLVTPTLTQANRHIGVCKHPFTGETGGLQNDQLTDVLLLKRFTMYDGLSVPFRIELELQSESQGIPRHGLVGRFMSVRVNYTDQSGPAERYLGGYISRFAQVGSNSTLATYRATLVPWLALLGKKTDCKVHRGSIPSVVQAIFDSYSSVPGVLYDVSKLDTEIYKTLDAPLVQYRESDLQFVMRLLEHAGIYFYFDHTTSGHTLFLTDDPGASLCAWPDGSDTTYETLDFQQYQDGTEKLHAWDAEHMVQPGEFTHRSYDPDLPADVANATGTMTRTATNSYGTEYDTYFEDLTLFDYPGEFEKGADSDREVTGDLYARVRMEEILARRQVFTGRATYRGIAPGYLVQVSGLSGADLDGEYLVTSATHHGMTDDYDTSNPSGFDASRESFQVSFSAIDSDVQYRPPRRTPKPVVQGPQTATVVDNGVASGAVNCDSWGNVYIHFHWDRVRTSASSVKTRVSQAWAGNGHGSVHTPHPGDEVIINFLEGDPDQPIITGRVYNDTNQPFLTLPDEKDITLLAKDEFGNFIIMDAMEGSEAITISTPKNSTSLVLGPSGIAEKTTADKSVVTVGNSESVGLGDSRSVSLGNSVGVSIGTSWGLSVGPSCGVNLGISSSSVSVGNSLSASYGYVCNYNRGGGYAYGKAPTLTEGGESVDNHRGLRALNSFKEVRLYAGPDGVGPQKASLVTMTGDTLTLAYGKGTRDTKEGIHNVRWSVVGANICALIAAAAGAGATAAAQAITTSIDAEGDDGTDSGRHRANSDDRETLTPGQYFGQAVGLLVASATSIGFAAASAAILKKLGDRSAPMEDSLNTEDARIDLTTVGVKHTAGTSVIDLLMNGDISIETGDTDAVNITAGGDVVIKSGGGKAVKINKAVIKTDGNCDLINLLVMP